jgi:hypothetical protein
MLFKHNWQGTEHVFDIPITEAEYTVIKNGGPFPKHLNADQREFFITGCPPGEFDKMFEDEDMLESMCDPDALLPDGGSSK